MIIMEYKFAPSVNIIRDADVKLNYIPTPNSEQVFKQILNNYAAGLKCFNIVGAYGTGKSSFLWAFKKTINHEIPYFDLPKGFLNETSSFEFLPIVGDYSSITQLFAETLGLGTKDFSANDLIQCLDSYYKSLSKSKKGLVIVIDEFGKFLEFAAKNNPEFELYFVQQLAEYINDPSKNVLLLSSLHQDFNAYSRDLSRTLRLEWDKVKGRLKEITFNEPVEQLLYLASERLKSLKVRKKDKHFSNLFDCIDVSKAFPLKDYFTKRFAEKLLPFDILSASVLTLSLQKYGQNERSLFSFIESQDHFGIQDFDSQNEPYYNLSWVYDYLLYNYYSFLSTKYNPHYAQWGAIRTAIEKTESLLEKNIHDASKLIKSIGLLNIFSSAGVKIDQEFLVKYGKYSLGIDDPLSIIKILETFKIIRFVNHSSKYILFEGTDLDIELAINEAGDLIERVSNVIHYLNEYFDFPYIPAKASYYDKGTPRFFEFRLSQEPIEDIPRGKVDGFINLIFSDSLSEAKLKKASKNSNEAILYGWYKNTNDIQNLLFELEKIKKVRENNIEDKVALRELDGILAHQKALLNHFVLGNIYSDNASISWYFCGSKQKIIDRKSFNRVLSAICDQVYPDTPVYKNEMVNKTRLSSAISTAKKNFVRALVENWDKKDIGFAENKFPAEKTIYLSLLKEIGIHSLSDGNFILQAPEESSFQPLWEAGLDFLKSAKSSRRNLQDFVDILSNRPFKLKQGFIEFWLPVFLFVKRNDYALFSKEGYIPYISDEDLELIIKKPKDYEIKAFDIQGIKLDLFNQYRQLLQQTSQNKLSNQGFIETIKPFLTFYKSLPDYAKQTKRLDKRTLSLREAISQAKDPEKTFFEDFPGALGYSIVKLKNNHSEFKEYIECLQDSIKEIRSCFDQMVSRFESYITNEILGQQMPFPEYKILLQKRYKKLKGHLLLPHQKIFYQRLNSPLDDQKSWLSSIAQACINKRLDNFTDKDEEILYEKLTDIIHELDNLCDLNTQDIDTSKEDVFRLEITSFVEGIQKNLIRIPKNKQKELQETSEKLNSMLGSNKHWNVAILTKLLQEQLRNDK